MKNSSLSPAKFSTSLSEGSLSRTPQLPSTTPSIGTNGRNNPYTSLLSPQLNEEQLLKKLNKNNPSSGGNHNQNNAFSNTLPNSSMHAIYKMIAKLPFEVRERVTSIVNMALFTADNSQKQYEGLKLEHLTLKSQHKKKLLEYDSLTQRCEIFHEQIMKLEEKLGALQDDAESRQTYAIRNSKAISRLSSTNKTLIDAFTLLNDGHPPTNNQNIPRTRAMSQRSTQRRKNNLLSELNSPPRTSSPEEMMSSNPSSPVISRKSTAIPNTTAANTTHTPSTKPTNHANSSQQEVSVTKNEKLRERLLRVAKDHNRVVKNVENLESKIQGLRSSLRYAERRNRQLQLELDEIRENQSLENTSLVKNPADGGENTDRRGNSGTSKHMKDRMDTRLSVLVNRNAFDPMDGIKYMDSMIAHLSATPSNLIEEDIVRHLCSRNACNLFETEKISIYILQPGGKYMNRYITNCSRIDRIKLGERESIAENILHHGLIRRYNNLKQAKNLYYNPDIDSAGDITLKRILSVPLREMGQGRVIGVCQLLNKRDNNKFSEVDELYVTAYGEMCGGLVSGSILFRRVWNESAIITGIIQAPYQLLQAVPQKDTLSSTIPLNIVDLLYTLEHVIRDALKCSKVKAFLFISKTTISSFDTCGGSDVATPNIIIDDIGHVYSLKQSAITMMTLKSSQLSLKISSKQSGVAGHVITSHHPYLVQQSSFDPWLNPEVDMTSSSLEQPFYCVPIINYQNHILGCLQLAPSPLSPNLTLIQDKIEPLALSFERAADWLAYSIAENLSNILQSIGKPSARPDLILSPITLTEKLATMPLNLQPSQPEAIRKRRATLVKSVTMAEESSHLPGGGLYDNKDNKSSTKDEDLRDFLLQFPDYEAHQHQHQQTQGIKESTSASSSRAAAAAGAAAAGTATTPSTSTSTSATSTSNQNRIPNTQTPHSTTTTTTPANDSLDTHRSSPTSHLVSPHGLSHTPSVDPQAHEMEIESLKNKYEREVNGMKSELFFIKEKSKNEINKLTTELFELKQQQKEHNQIELKSVERRYEENLKEYQEQFERDLRQLRREQEEEKLLLQKNIKQLEETIQNLQMKLTYVDKPIDKKHLEVVGTLIVTDISITGLTSIATGPSEAIIQVKLGDGSNWSHLSQSQSILNNEVRWNQLDFNGKISQAQLPIDTLSLRIKEKRGGVVKLIGVANLDVSSLITQSNQWITLTGPLQDKEGKSTNQGVYNLRIRYHREDQEPVVDELEKTGGVFSTQEEMDKTAGYLEIQEISFLEIKSQLRKNLFTECVLNSHQDWSHLTDLQSFPENSSKYSWTRLTLTGKVLKDFLELGVTLRLKQQKLPQDILLGEAQIDSKSLLSKPNEWMNLEGPVVTPDGNETGRYLIRMRYRQEDQDSSLLSVPLSQPHPIEPSSSVVEEALPSSEPLVPSEKNQTRKQKSFSNEEKPVEIEEKVKEDDQELATDQLDESPDLNHDLVDDIGHEEELDSHLPLEFEKPPPTPTKEEISNSPRIGSWAQMQDEEGNVYYYNTVTQETSWHPPAELSEGVEMDVLDPIDGAIGGLGEEVIGSHHDLDGGDVGQIRNGDWIQLQDDGGNFYWYNEVTGQSSWEIPCEDPELYSMPDPSGIGMAAGVGDGAAYASASAGGYTIEL